MEIEEGYIKFKCNYSFKSSSELEIHNEIYDELILYRQKLYDLGLIGSVGKGIGFGNISTRISESKFLITGTATGNIESLSYRHFSLVYDWFLDKNEISCAGELKASSESLTHAAIYQSLSYANAVIHFHSENLWNRYLDKYQTTPKYAEYGTTDLAIEINKTINSNRLVKTIILGGHKDGIITYDSNLKNAFENILLMMEKV